MHEATSELDRIIRRPELLKVTGLSAATLYRLMAEDRFPKPMQLSENSVGWRASSVASWLQELDEVATHSEAERRPAERSGDR